MDDQHEHLTDEIADHEARARREFWLSPQTSTLLLPFQSGLVVASGLYEGAAN